MILKRPSLMRKSLLSWTAILAMAGADFRNVLRVTVYLLDVNDRTLINPVRKEYFGETRPASTLIGISELAIPGMKVEIEAVVGLRRQEK